MSKILELAKRIASTGGLETKTTETISGTYDSAGQQRLLSHAYTIGANLTITNGELILSRLADNGTGMTVEFGSDVTLSGDGTLMLGDLGQGQPNQDFSASRITGTLPNSLFPAGHVLATAIICDEKAYNVHGGAFNSGAWRTRDLNKKISDVNDIVSLDSNQFTLQAGNYLIEWTAPAFNVTYHVSKLRGITSSSNRGYGTSDRTGVSGGDTAQESIGTAYVSLSGAEAFEIQHKCTTTRSLGFGAGQNSLDSGTVSIFTIVKITKTA